MEYIWTPFYRTSTSQYIECSPQLESNYTPYLQYSLKNWLYYHISKKIGKDIELEYIEVPKNKKLYLTIKILKDEKILDLTKESQTLVHNIIKDLSINKLDWIPIIYFDTDIFCDTGTKIPVMWINQLLNYINIDESYQSYISNIGIMANLSSYPDYIEIQAKLALEIKNKLVDMYIKGTVLLPPPNIINNWNLNQISDLYQANWSNKKIINGFNNMTDFLISRILGDTNLYLHIGDNFINVEEELYLRYMISNDLYKIGIKMEDFIYTADGIEISVTNFNIAMLILSIIDKNNLILKKDVPNYSIVYFPMLKSDELITSKGIVYRFNDKERPYIYSYLIKK